MVCVCVSVYVLKCGNSTSQVTDSLSIEVLNLPAGGAKSSSTTPKSIDSTTSAESVDPVTVYFSFFSFCTQKTKSVLSVVVTFVAGVLGS